MATSHRPQDTLSKRVKPLIRRSSGSTRAAPPAPAPRRKTVSPLVPAPAATPAAVSRAGTTCQHQSRNLALRNCLEASLLPGLLLFSRGVLNGAVAVQRLKLAQASLAGSIKGHAVLEQLSNTCEVKLPELQGERRLLLRGKLLWWACIYRVIDRKNGDRA